MHVPNGVLYAFVLGKVDFYSKWVITKNESEELTRRTRGRTPVDRLRRWVHGAGEEHTARCLPVCPHERARRRSNRPPTYHGTGPNIRPRRCHTSTSAPGLKSHTHESVDKNNTKDICNLSERRFWRETKFQTKNAVRKSNLTPKLSFQLSIQNSKNILTTKRKQTSQHSDTTHRSGGAKNPNRTSHPHDVERCER